MTPGQEWVLALSGGVGGAKLCFGLQAELPPSALQVLVNTADDFRHLGLYISPDIDTLLYTLSGRNNREQGWGLEGETWQVLDALAQLDPGEAWFRLGDRDLATHLWRSQRLASGASLSAVTRELAERFGIPSGIHPMSDTAVATEVLSDEGRLPFQRYFVQRRCEPRVHGFEFVGLENAIPSQSVLDLLAGAPPLAIILCPSNPFVSLDPILSVPGMWQRLAQCPAPVVAVSPIVAGNALKGPAAKMMNELDMPATAAAVAQHYQRHYPGLVDSFVIDESDAKLASEITALGLDVYITPTVMLTDRDKRDLARRLLERVA